MCKATGELAALHESHGENNVQQNLSACSSAKLDCGSAKSEELTITFWPVQYICAAPCAHTQVQVQCLQPSCSQRPSSPQKVARIPHHAKRCANCCQGLLGLVDPRDWPSFQVAVSLLFDFFAHPILLEWTFGKWISLSLSVINICKPATGTGGSRTSPHKPAPELLEPAPEPSGTSPKPTSPPSRNQAGKRPACKRGSMALSKFA